MALRETTIVLILIAAAPFAAAQEEPTVNESDYETAPPTSDESYLDQSEQEAGLQESSSDPGPDPTLSESELDTSAPTADESYLDEAEREIQAEGTGTSATPGLGLVAALAAIGVALAARRR